MRYIRETMRTFRLIGAPDPDDRAPRYKPSGIWVEIGGLDKSGRTTQSALLARNLEGVLTYFPHYGSASGKLLFAFKADRIDSLHAMAYHHLWAFNAHECLPPCHEIKPGTPIISDGAWCDQSARAILDGIKDPSLVRSFRYGLPVPTLSIYLLDYFAPLKGEGLNQIRLRRSYRSFAHHAQMVCLKAPPAKSPYRSANQLQEQILDLLRERGLADVPLRYKYDRYFIAREAKKVRES